MKGNLDMDRKRKALAVIPARGGSKGLPRKNVIELCGKPLIAYTISAAIESGIFDKIIVSTDDSEIAEVSKRYGAEVPFMRPAELSGDLTTSDEVTAHALHFLSAHGIEFDDVCKLQPTSPLRTAKHLRESYEEFKGKNVDYMVSVCKCEHTPLWSLTLDRNGCLEGFIQGEQEGGRQGLPEYYRLNGVIYWAKTEKYLKTVDFCGDKFLAYIMDQNSSVDIDSKDDLALAEFYLRYWRKGE